jgi:hypothetical protein
MSIDGLQEKLRDFTSERDWGRFHTSPVRRETVDAADEEFARPNAAAAR